MKAGDKVYVPTYGKIVTVMKVENNRPTYGKYTDDAGNIQVVDLVVTTWEFITIAKALWTLIKSIFKRK